MKAETFFNADEKAKIAAAVKEVESKTSGEIAVMVVDSCDEYPEARLFAGLLTGGLVSIGIVDYFFGDSLWYFLLIALPLAFLFSWLVDYLPAVKRAFVTNGRLENQVGEQALQAFYQKGLYKTRDATGVLFFISLFEHKVWALADKGIYEKIDQAELQTYADDIANGIKTGTAAETLCGEIKKVGQILAEHFPVKPDDINELDNEVIIG